jgi:hypothetical protein
MIAFAIRKYRMGTLEEPAQGHQMPYNTHTKQNYD